jgi:hypothetical protein
MSDSANAKSSPDLRALARAILDTVLAGDRQPVAVAHPLEFVCIPLLRTPGLGVCGHIWQDGQAAPTVHCHSWHLTSEVIAGALFNEVFAVTDCSAGDQHLLDVESTGPLDRIAATGRTVTVRTEQRTLYETGDTYCLRAGVFHRSTPASTGPTITLLAGRTVPGANDRIVASRARAQRATRRGELPIPAARALAVLLRSAVGEPGPLSPAENRQKGRNADLPFQFYDVAPAKPDASPR